MKQTPKTGKVSSCDAEKMLLRKECASWPNQERNFEQCEAIIVRDFGSFFIACLAAAVCNGYFLRLSLQDTGITQPRTNKTNVEACNFTKRNPFTKARNPRTLLKMNLSKVKARNLTKAIEACNFIINYLLLGYSCNFTRGKSLQFHQNGDISHVWGQQLH